MLNIGVIAPGSYFVDGAYGISEATGPMPLQARFKVELMSNALEIIGSWQQHSGRPEHGFKLTLCRDHTSQSQTDVLVSGVGIGQLKGRATLKPSPCQVLAFDEPRDQVLSVHFTPAEDGGMFEVDGLVTVGGVFYAFSGRVIPTEGRASLSNVVPILGGKVA